MASLPPHRPSGPGIVQEPVENDPRFAPLAERIANRLRPVCAHMRAEDFHRLVVDVTRFKLRWSGEHPIYYPVAAPGEAPVPELPSPAILDAYFVEANDCRAVLEAAVNATLELTGADMVDVQLLDPASGALQIEAQRGFEQPFLQFFASVRAGAVACGTALRCGEPIVVEDVAQNELFRDTRTRDVMLAAGSRAVQSIPLIGSSGRPLGVLSTHYHRPHHPTTGERHLLGLLARRTAVGIECTSAVTGPEPR
jgi:hypothetical protein